MRDRTHPSDLASLLDRATSSSDDPGREAGATADARGCCFSFEGAAVGRAEGGPCVAAVGQMRPRERRRDLFPLPGDAPENRRGCGSVAGPCRARDGPGDPPVIRAADYTSGADRKCSQLPGSFGQASISGAAGRSCPDPPSRSISAGRSTGSTSVWHSSHHLRITRILKAAPDSPVVCASALRSGYSSALRQRGQPVSR